MPDSSSVADRPPWFGVTFLVMVLGGIVFLAGAALVRNAFVARDENVGDWLDAMLESHGDLTRIAGVAILVGLYPFVAPRRRMSLLPWFVLVGGMTMAVGPMIYWGWWHRQIPGFSRPGGEGDGIDGAP